jgi:hypothetical protein
LERVLEQQRENEESAGRREGKRRVRGRAGNIEVGLCEVERRSRVIYAR